MAAHGAHGKHRALRAEDADAQIQDDAYLAPFRDGLRHRLQHYIHTKENIERHQGSLAAFAEGYKVRSMRLAPMSSRAD